MKNFLKLLLTPFLSHLVLAPLCISLIILFASLYYGALLIPAEWQTFASETKTVQTQIKKVEWESDAPYSMFKAYYDFETYTNEVPKKFEGYSFGEPSAVEAPNPLYNRPKAGMTVDVIYLASNPSISKISVYRHHNINDAAYLFAVIFLCIFPCFLWGYYKVFKSIKYDNYHIETKPLNILLIWGTASFIMWHFVTDVHNVKEMIWELATGFFGWIFLLLFIAFSYKSGFIKFLTKKLTEKDQ